MSDSSRFSHLLNPIRDLAENWNVDIARDLEDYLSEVEHLQFSFDGNQETLNFAEAALLIQGSACVYSKKVEYLYKLVYGTLDMLAAKRKQNQTTSISDEGKDQDAEDLFEKQDELLPLDDIVEDNNIDLKVETEMKEKISRVPVSLIPLEDGEKVGDTALTTSKGIVIGNRSDFRMNTSIIHDSGALLLGLEDIRHVDESFQAPAGSSMSLQYQQQQQQQQQSLSTLTPNRGQVARTEGASGSDHSVRDPLLDDDDMGGFGGAGFDGPDDDGGMDAGPWAQHTHAAPAASATHTTSDQRLEEAEIEGTRADSNPWLRLDPHEPDQTVVNPFRRIKSYRVPKALVAAEKKKSAAAPKIAPATTITQFCRAAFSSSGSGTKSLPKSTLHSTAYPEFQSMFWAEQKRRAANQKQDKAKLKSLQTARTKSGAPAAPVDSHELSLAQIEAEQDDFGAGGFGGDEEYEYEHVAGSEDIDFHIHAAEAHAGGTAGIVAALSQAPKTTYEDLVRAHIEKYMAEAEQYAQETELSARVTQWEARMKPVLEAEEAHGPFDIHNYGATVLERFPTAPKAAARPVKFSDLAHTAEPFQVCRLFLATLQLANSGNVQIISEKSSEFSVKLLNRTRLHLEELEHFRAPSLV